MQLATCSRRERNLGLREAISDTRSALSITKYDAINYLGLGYNRMEDCSIEIKGEVQQIFRVLNKSEQDKMPFEGIEIAKTLTRVPFFKRFFDLSS